MTTGSDARKNLEENRLYWRSSHYYELAEPDMDGQWHGVLWPILSGCDLSVVVELAPGHGRNTRKLLEVSRELHLVDLNAECIAACRARFGVRDGLHYHVNDGLTLPAELRGRVTLVYCWDAMVHFHRDVVAAYLRETSAALAPGGRAFLHHADLAPGEVRGEWTSNPHWRSDVTRDFVRDAAARVGLEVESQSKLRWAGEIDDCISVLVKHR